MNPTTRVTLAVLAAVAADPVLTTLAAQSTTTPACALLSVAEVRQLTGRKDYPDYADGEPLGEGLGGGSSCQYGGETISSSTPLVSVVLIPGRKGSRSRSSGAG